MKIIKSILLTITLVVCFFMQVSLAGLASTAASNTQLHPVEMKQFFMGKSKVTRTSTSGVQCDFGDSSCDAQGYCMETLIIDSSGTAPQYHTIYYYDSYDQKVTYITRYVATNSEDIHDYQAKCTCSLYGDGRFTAAACDLFRKCQW
jgi:hypothetical protein